MRTQFFYTRKVTVPGGPADTPDTKEVHDSFNLEHVVRSLTMTDGTVLVLLDDIHERTVEQPNI